MIKTKLFLAALACLGVASTAQAHFLWVDLAPTATGRQICVSFAEAPGPGEAHLVDRIASTKAWIRQPAGESQPLDLKSSVDEANGEGQWISAVELPPTASIEAQCQYGVFERGETALLLTYFAKHLQAPAAEEIATLARAERLALDIVPQMTDGKWSATVLWQGEPVSEAEVVATDAHDETYELKTDEQGRVQLPSELGQRFSIRARHIEPERSGELDGKSYSQAWTICTATVALGDSSDEVPATELLSQARASRAVWEDFPGFTASLRLHVDNKSETGQITVDEDGNVELTGFATLADGFVQQQLDSLVMHRMPGSSFDDAATFAAEDGEHVLGRLIELNEPSMGSVYRIGENVVTEVNRSMGRQRFTISVLDVYWNADHKYVPHVYTVSFWNNESGNLETSHTYFHEWKQLESFDLPERFIVVTTAPNRRSVLRADFSDVKLLD